MRGIITGIALILFLSGCQSRVTEVPSVTANLTPQTSEVANQVFPVSENVSAPEGLRPCCAFGYDLGAKLGPVPVPFYRIGNVLTTESLGEHVYNDSFWFGITEVIGLSNENLGIIYSRKGGFIDIAHVRDTADYTYYLFTQIYPRLGEAWMLTLTDELASRRVQFRAFTPPDNAADRYTLSVYLAARLAFRMAVWHEIAQWYGYHSVPGFSEEISAFTLEDLYSNLLGARLAITLLLEGHGRSVADFNQECRAFCRPHWHSCPRNLQMQRVLHLTVLIDTGGINVSGCRRNFWCCTGIIMWRTIVCRHSRNRKRRPRCDWRYRSIIATGHWQI